MFFSKKSFEERTECLLKFAGDLTDQTCREDMHEIFSTRDIQWIDFIRGAKEVNFHLKNFKIECFVYNAFCKDPI